MGKPDTVDVCAAVIMRDGRMLLTTRPPGTHLAGRWEFPGGKVHPEETHDDCIIREIREELGLTVDTALPITSLTHEYPEKTVRLHFLDCTVPESECPHPAEAQEVGWFNLDEAAALPLADADSRFVDFLATRDAAATRTD